MLRIKRLYLYILQTFVPVFFMTFAISLFIILMQFLWKYVEDLVGKGLEPHVLGELFTYAALNLVPMALPLAILLASLMSFGNLGERYELLAIKAAGVSLLRAMRPLIVLMVFICVGAFFFQNDIIPKVNVKFRTLMISIKQKSPELDIPVGIFYSDIENYNLYVGSRNKETGTLLDVMIYDVSKGFDNMAVIVCDSAKMKMSSNKDYLMLDLYSGQQFANFQQGGINRGGYNNKFVPYSRENFKEKQFIIPFDAGFTRIDESSMEGTQISKNISQLRASIDSLSLIVDTMNINDRKYMLDNTYLAYRSIPQDTMNNEMLKTSNFSNLELDSLIHSLSNQNKISLYNDALTRAENNKNDFMFRTIAKVDIQKKIRYHDVELQRKFTLSFACLVFFFIGAPLGAIIRKGGLGMPVVISVILFIVYYIIDNLGYKMARDGVWVVWQGVWLSSIILFPLGTFLTYKAMNDSALFNAEAYTKFFAKLLFIKKANNVDADNQTSELIIPALSELDTTGEELENFRLLTDDQLIDVVKNYSEYGYKEDIRYVGLNLLKDRGIDISLFERPKDYSTAIMYNNEFRKNSKVTILFYLMEIILLISGLFVESKIIEWFTYIFLVGYIFIYLRSMAYYKAFQLNLNITSNKKLRAINTILSFFIYPFMYIYMKKGMGKKLPKVRTK